MGKIIKCGCYFNSVGFEVKRKYLYLTKNNRAIDKIELSKNVIERLEEIANKYFYNDVKRTIAVLEMFDYFYNEEEF